MNDHSDAPQKQRWGVVTVSVGGGALPGVPEAWNLALGAVPVALAVALVFQSTARPRDDVSTAS